jgi:hypothetical protein
MYFGVSISNTTFADSDEGVTVKYDKNNYKALVGKRIDANISVEGQYLNFAETDLDVENETVFDPFAFSGRSIGLSGLYYFEPQEEFSPFVKLGVHSWNVETIFQELTDKFSGSDILYGLGADGKINDYDNIKYRAEFERLKINDEDMNIDFDVFSVGLLFDY